MDYEEIVNKIIKEVKSTKKKLDKLHEDKGTFNSPIDIDIDKTLKAMSYENILTILREGKQNGKNK